MKAGIHPQWYQATVTCACGNTFTAGSTKPTLQVEICSQCHPFFTGEMKFVDSLGRVERFQQKQAQGGGAGYISKKQKKAMRKREEEKEEAQRPKSLKEMMDRVKAGA